MKVKNCRGYTHLPKEYLHGILLHIEQGRAARGFALHQRPVRHDTLAGHYCFTYSTI